MLDKQSATGPDLLAPPRPALPSTLTSSDLAVNLSEHPPSCRITKIPQRKSTILRPGGKKLERFVATPVFPGGPANHRSGCHSRPDSHVGRVGCPGGLQRAGWGWTLECPSPVRKPQGLWVSYEDVRFDWEVGGTRAAPHRWAGTAPRGPCPMCLAPASPQRCPGLTLEEGPGSISELT